MKDKTWPCEHITMTDGNWHYHELRVGHWIQCPRCPAKHPEESKPLWEALVGKYVHSEWKANYSSIAKNDAIIALQWFRENFPDISEETRKGRDFDSVFIYLSSIEEWIDEEIGKCK